LTTAQKIQLLSAAIALSTGVFATAPAIAHAEDPCPRVCITDVHVDGSHLHVAWAGPEQFAYYQRAFDIADVRPGATYKVQLLGCTATTPWYADGRCASVDEKTLTT
jgi:hypothetical protein